MAKTIHIKVTDEMYYNLVSVKAKHQLDTWIQLFEYIIKHEYTELTKQPNQTYNPHPEQPNQTKHPNGLQQPKQPHQPEHPFSDITQETPIMTAPVCLCGHPENYHDNESGCLANGCTCTCKQYQEAPI